MSGGDFAAIRELKLGGNALGSASGGVLPKNPGNRKKMAVSGREKENNFSSEIILRSLEGPSRPKEGVGGQARATVHKGAGR